MRLIAAAALILALLASGIAVGATATSTATTTTLVPLADAYVNSNDKKSNHGEGKELQADASPTIRSYMRFEVPRLSQPISRALLGVYVTGKSSRGLDVRSVSDNTWGEKTIDYSNAPAPGAVVASSGPFGSDRWVSLDVTSLVRANRTLTLALTTVSNTRISVASRETDATAPQLLIQTAAVTPPNTGLIRFEPRADARVKEAYPNTNYGSITYLRVDGGSDPDVDSYLRFAVNGVAGHVDSAKLRLHAYTDTVDGPAIYRTTNSWAERTITWNNRPAPTSAAVDDAGLIPTNSWVEYDVTPLVQGDGTYSFMLATSSTDGVYFRSREASTFGPELLVAFRPPASP